MYSARTSLIIIEQINLLALINRQKLCISMVKSFLTTLAQSTPTYLSFFSM